jgi:hypothetical protein
MLPDGIASEHEHKPQQGKARNEPSNLAFRLSGDQFCHLNILLEGAAGAGHLPAPRWLALLNGPDDEVPAPDKNRDTDQDRNDERRHFSSPSLFVPSDDHQLSELRSGCSSHDGIA